MNIVCSRETFTEQTNGYLHFLSSCRSQKYVCLNACTRTDTCHVSLYYSLSKSQFKSSNLGIKRSWTQLIGTTGIDKQFQDLKFYPITSQPHPTILNSNPNPESSGLRNFFRWLGEIYSEPRLSQPSSCNETIPGSFVSMFSISLATEITLTLTKRLLLNGLVH